MKSICFPVYFLSDERVRVLTKPEKADFFAFCCLAAVNRRCPGVIPAMEPRRRAKKLGLDFKMAEKRLERFLSEGIELIERQTDGSLLIVDFAEWNGLDDGADYDVDEDEAHFGDNRRSLGDGIARTVGAQRQERQRRRDRLRGEIASLNAAISAATDEETRQQLQGDLSVALAELASLNRRRNGTEPGVTQNGKSNALEAKNNAQASQNDSLGVTGASREASQPGQKGVTNGVTEASHPSRARDVNVQRSPGFNSSDEERERNTDLTLNVTERNAPPSPVTPGAASSVTSSAPHGSPGLSARPVSQRARGLAAQAVATARELHDLGSEGRHYQLLAIAEEHGATHLLQEALESTRRRQASHGKPPLNKPGAYYQDAVKRLFERHDPQIFIPTRAELDQEQPEYIRALLRESLGSGVTPLDEIYGAGEFASVSADPEGYVP